MLRKSEQSNTGGALHVTPEEPAPAPEPKKKVRKGNTADERIAKLTKEANDAASYAMEQERLRTAAESELRQLREQNKFLTEANIVSYEADANEKLARAKIDLKRAIEAGDVEAQIEANERLAKATALQGQVATYKIQNRPSTAPKTEAPRQQMEQPVRRNPVADAWIERNPWVKNDSEDFQQEKAQDALEYAENLAAELAKQGRGAEIGTKRYFDAVDKYISETYSEEEEPINSPPPSKKAGSPVAGQARMGDAPKKQESQRITLSPAQQQVAMMLNLRDENGNILSKEEHFKAYARSLAADGKHSARDAAMAQRR